MVKAPEIMSGIPRIVVGNGFQYLANSPRNGATAQKIRETDDDTPTAWDLKLVG